MRNAKSVRRRRPKDRRDLLWHLAFSIWHFRLVAIVGLAGALGAGCRTAGSALPPPAAMRAGAAAGSAARTTPVDPTTLNRKLLFGYQGWFGCPEDGSPLGAWEHWFRRGTTAAAATVRVDMWPDVSELTSGERCRTPFTLPDGRDAQLYSAYNPRTVDRHFR